MKLDYRLYTFERMTNLQLYRLLQLRQEVFVVEQECPYLDCDDIDLVSLHVLGYDEHEKIEACSRLVPPGYSYSKFVSIGRVVTSRTIRGRGHGKALMTYSIHRAIETWPDYDIKISAQTYAVAFYSSLGFVVTGEEYLEDDIPHVAMVLK